MPSFKSRTSIKYEKLVQRVRDSRYQYTVHSMKNPTSWLKIHAQFLIVSYATKLKENGQPTAALQSHGSNKGKGEVFDHEERWGIDSHDRDRTEAIRDLVHKRFLDTLCKGCQGKMREINPMLTYNEQQQLWENISMKEKTTRLQVAGYLPRP